MDFVGKAKRIRVYLEESDVIGHRPAPYALLDWLRREGAAGATVIRATAGLGSSGHLNLDIMPDISAHLPVIVEWIDSPDRVERLLPQLKQMVGRGLITAEDTEILLYKAHGVRTLPNTVTVEQVMSRDVVSVAPQSPLRKVVELVEGKVYRAVPVVEDGRPVGMITNLDLVERGGLLVRVELLGSLSDAERTSALNQLGGKTAHEVMTPNPVTVVEGATITAVADVMAHKRLKRLPVVDAERRVVGIVTDEEVLDRVTPAMRTGALKSLMHRLPFVHVGKAELEAEHHARARKAADLMLTDVAIAREDQLLRDAIAPMMRAPHKLVAVVDKDGRLTGALDRADILRGLIQE